jgi:hypothetical protein
MLEADLPHRQALARLKALNGGLPSTTENHPNFDLNTAESLSANTAARARKIDAARLALRSKAQGHHLDNGVPVRRNLKLA